MLYIASNVIGVLTSKACASHEKRGISNKIQHNTSLVNFREFQYRDKYKSSVLSSAIKKYVTLSNYSDSGFLLLFYITLP